MPLALNNHPEVAELLEAFFVLRSTGQKPWDLGIDVPRRKFAEAVAHLSALWETHQITQQQPQCPFMGAQE